MVDPTVCHIPPVTPKNQPQPVNIPSIPPAQPDLQSLVHTVNTMRQVLQTITNQITTVNNTGGTISSPSAPGSFTESKRVTETVRVFQNGDKTSENWVDVEQTNQLIMKAGKQTWTYNRG